MSVVAWASNTIDAFLSHPPRKAAAMSGRAFASGVRDRLVFATLRLTPTPTYSTTLLGHKLTMLATCREDVRRARTLNGEIPVARWLAWGGGGGTVFWDVGAYHGHYSTLMADHGTDVIAFEPDVETIPRVRMNGALNGHSIPVYSVALSDHTGTRLFGGPKASENAIGHGGGIVPTRRGDDITPAPDVVKIDVEGHEESVLVGMKHHLETVERVAIEVHADESVPCIVDLLHEAGLMAGELDTDRVERYIVGFR